MKTALIGLTQSGKSTILSAISGRAVPPIGSTAIEEAIVPVPDERLDWLTGLYKPKKTVLGTSDCLDLPGFNFTDEHGRAAARRLINKVRTIDLIVLVVRSFENPLVPPYRNSVNPLRDLEELKTELLLADLELVTTRIENLEKQLKKPGKGNIKEQAELELQKRLQDAIESEKPISAAIENEHQRELVRSLGFLTLKPIVIAVNTGEEQLDMEFDFTKTVEGAEASFSMCAKLEQELFQLDAESKREFMADMGIKEPAAKKFVSGCYQALGMISFLTVGSDEVRAWPIKQGTTALDAAGKVHTDIKRGFIRAETMAYNDLRERGSEKDVKAAGKVRLEGKEYVVQDGDIINFRVNI
ncbi:MAG: redox-regulated ATPase YchF [Candidatus Brocadiia bacterium]|nr:MAG: redox-regulated ATPase YchF [Candidatus Brocadiia bacterium]